MGVFLSFLVLFFHFAGSKMADFSHTGLLLFGKHCPLTFLLFWACFFFFFNLGKYPLGVCCRPLVKTENKRKRFLS